MSGQNNEMEEHSYLAASGFRTPSVRAKSSQTPRMDVTAGAVGQAFLEKMAPPRRPVKPAYTLGLASTMEGVSFTADMDKTKEAQKLASALPSHPALPWGSTPSIPSAITHPVLDSHRQDGSTAARQTSRRAPRTKPPAVEGVTSVPPLRLVMQEVSSGFDSGPGTTTFHGHAAFTVLADMDISTPSMMLKLVFKDEKVICNISGFLISHPFDLPLQSRVEDNMKVLKQEILGQPVDNQLLIKIGVSIGQLKREEGSNVAVIPSRLVHVVMDQFNYARVEDIVIQQRQSKEGLVELTINGLQWKKMTAFSLQCLAGFRKAFPDDGKMTTHEQKYYNDMPLLGLEDALSEEDLDAMAVVNPIDSGKSTREVLVPKSRKHQQASTSSSNEHAGTKAKTDSMRDSPMEDNFNTSDTVNHTGVSINHDIQFPKVDARSPGKATRTSSVPHISILKRARENNNWNSITATSIRAFLDEEGEHQSLHVRKSQLIQVATAVLDRKSNAEDENDGEKMEKKEEFSARPKSTLRLKNSSLGKKKDS